MASTVSTRFLIISDTHNFEFQNNNLSRPFREPVPDADVVLHCGDLTNEGGPEYYKKCLDIFRALNAELKLVIPGNHDLDLDKEWWTTHLPRNTVGTGHDQHANSLGIMTGPIAAEAGVTYLEEGTNTFTLRNGARFSIYTSPYTPEFCDWGFAYNRSEDRFNPEDQVAKGYTSIATNPIPTGVDIVMTHGPPHNILDACPGGNVGCPSLLNAVGRVRPLLHCFGHIHEGHGARLVTWNEQNKVQEETSVEVNYPSANDVCVGRGKQTLMVNAAIQVNPPDWKSQMEPNNAPWLVDLQLPRAD
ncbi:hypothetical protein BP5796_00649 [Coleophoma crateriformis]|uniref:Calcineurin-like phosphoesterase domain-containing protein n=1 Tax=Coleophoma crateriformis TaxID=565419 RepID=A0A3D8T8L4_9HELO|nr:hypothetical protein BP5796_00649 [Coleophoma crateriformis]